MSHLLTGVARLVIGSAAVLMAASAHAFDVQGHRGARGLLPENTLPAFAKALEIGVDTIECDLGITKDGEVVIYHDRRLNPDITRGPDGQWLGSEGPRISELTLAELQRYDVGRIRPGSRYAEEFADQTPMDGTRIPRFADLLALIRQSGNDHVGIDCETKVSPRDPASTWPIDQFVDRVVAEIRKADMQDRTMIQSFDWRTLQRLRQVEPRIRTMYLSEASTLQRSSDGGPSPWLAGFDPDRFDGSVARAVAAAGGHLWAPYHDVMTPGAVAEAHALGLEVIPWTVNDTDTMHKLLAMGVDGIISDRPDVVKAAVQAHKAESGFGAHSMLRTQGTAWVDAKGQPVNLRGANLGNWLIMEFWMMGQRTAAIDDQCTLEATLDRRFGVPTRERLLHLFRDNWITQRDWNLMASFGLNLVRVPFMWSVIEDARNPKTLRADAWRYLDDSIEQARRRGMYVVLDLHGAVGAQGLEHHSGCAERNQYWHTPAYRERTVWLWQQIAARYKDNPVVAGYSLLNEPWGASETEMVAAVKELYAAVRTVDANHVILLPGHLKGIGAYGVPADSGMRNVAFEMHFYPGHFGWGKPGLAVHRDWLTCRGGQSGTCEWAARMKALDAPLFVGEFQPWADMPDELGALLTRATFDRYNALGWAGAVWSWKAVSNEGGLQPGVWGLATNATDEKLPPIDFATAPLEQIEQFFRRVGTIRYATRDAIANAMHRAEALPLPQ